MTLAERIKQLEQAQGRVKQRIAQAAQNATRRAIEVAAEKTPPVEDAPPSGTNTRGGSLKEHWATDSKITPAWRGNTVVTELNNDKEYASYVNDGHRMDRHFVPGLYVNPYDGALEYDPTKKVGLVVGTQTPYVPGVFMEEAGIEAYHKTMREELKDLEALFR